VVGDPACREEPLVAEELNVRGTMILASAVSPQQLIIIGFMGTNYGAVEEICTEDYPLNPLSLYG
jgi:hypothetical protein